MSKKLLGNLMKQAQMMQEKMQKVQEEAAAKTVEASAGGGMVTVTANGKMEILSIKIEKEAVDPNDVDMLQDLVAAAVNEALRKAQDMMNEEMGKVTGGPAWAAEEFRDCFNIWGSAPSPARSQWPLDPRGLGPTAPTGFGAAPQGLYV